MCSVVDEYVIQGGNVIKINYDSSTPVFQQLAEAIEEDILTGVYQESEKVMSTTQLSKFLKVNATTSVKAIKELQDRGILYKKVGIGMFVVEGARDIILEKRLIKFKEESAPEFVKEAIRLGISIEEVITLLKEVKLHED